MSLVTPEPCAFDWDGTTNDKLKGGRLLAVTDHRFAYVFTNGDGRFTNGFIAHVNHGEDILSLLTTYSDEMAHLLREVLNFMGEVDGYNVYANEGRPAGMTVGDHAHLHIVCRSAGEPASGMGLAKLVTEYNKLHDMHDLAMRSVFG